MYVVVLDDAELNTLLVVEALRDLPGVNLETFTHPQKALAFALSGIDLGLVIVDYDMPGMNGIAFTRAMLSEPHLSHTPVVMITSFDQRAIRRQALDSGVTDFLGKPFDPLEIRARAKNLLALNEARLTERDRAAWLSREVAKAVATIEEREREIVTRLVMVTEHRDTDTGLHVQRVASYVRLISRGLGLSDAETRALALASTMHDVGKVAISDAILLKEGPLSADERAAINTHTMAGFAMLDGSTIQVLQLAAAIALGHHERWDGRGYPRELRGEAIPLGARITAVADSFDALTSDRPYKAAWSLSEAREFVLAQAGKHFDPRCVEAFMSDWPAVEAVARTAAPGGSREACRLFQTAGRAAIAAEDTLTLC